TSSAFSRRWISMRRRAGRGSPICWPNCISRRWRRRRHNRDLWGKPGARGSRLSGGEPRGAEIPRALVMSPRFMLLDEPFAGIDPIAVTEIQKIVFHLKERGIGVLITDHNVLSTLKITDRAYIVHDGMIFRSGTPPRLAAAAEW